MFQGYSQETVDFMWGIRFNNESGESPTALQPKVPAKSTPERG